MPARWRGRTLDEVKVEYVSLGRTGLLASRLGLGGGGHSRLGSDADPERAVSLVRRALDLGINLIDTAEGYGTEEIIGRGIRGLDRGRILLSTKKSLRKDRPLTTTELRQGLEQSLGRLGTDYIDVYHLHAVSASQYDHALNVLGPELIRLKKQGLIRTIGVTEPFIADPGHIMLQRAMADDCWDVVMVGFNILNQCARDRVLAAARRKDVGVLCMFAVRTALSRAEKLLEVTRTLIATRQLNDAEVGDPDDPLGFVVRGRAATNLVDAAYRFCRDEPGVHVVLSGTGDERHLEANVSAMEAPPLPEAVRARLIRMFRHVDTVSGN